MPCMADCFFCPILCSLAISYTAQQGLWWNFRVPGTISLGGRDVDPLQPHEYAVLLRHRSNHGSHIWAGDG